MMRNKRKILYLHGLESPQGGEKVDFLATQCYVHAPKMDYTRHDIFSFLIETIEDFKPDVIIGSSMGGYAAYVLGGLYKIPVVAFNPALHSRSFDPNFPKFIEKHMPDELTIIIGEKDTIIDGDRTLDYLKDHLRDRTVKYSIEHVKKMGHRVPLDVFINMYNKII
jgi:hypoxanthine phosphoribosyltransferase